MPSPLHKYLFSPPPSPPRKLPTQGPRTTRPIPRNMTSSLSTAEQGLKARSPRTPTQATFTLDVTCFPVSKSAPTTPRRSISPSIILTREDDVEATPMIDSTPRRRTPCTVPSSPREKTDSSNIPTVSYSHKMPSSLPRPLLRLFFLSSLVMTCIFFMSSIPGAQLPSLRAAAVSRRLALAPDGRAYYEAIHPVSSWEEARERDYVPPQIKAHHMMKRAEGSTLSSRLPGPAAAHPKTDRPTPAGRPLPPTHELLALQSYILQSENNFLPASINPLKPLDANIVLGFEADEDALEELERERLDEVVVWYGGDGTTRSPKDHLAMLSALHGPKRRPTLLSIHDRSDLPLLLDILTRLDLPLQHGHPLVVIGNQPFVADIERMEEMRGSGQLEEMLELIGWVDKSEPIAEPSASVAAGREWKPKLAKWEKKEISEVEHALQAARK